MTGTSFYIPAPRRQRVRKLATLLLLTCSLTACSSGSSESPSGERTEQRVAVIEVPYNKVDDLSAPDTVAPGKPFEVTFTTFATGCIEPDEVTVRTEDQLTVVTPYDLYVFPDGDVGCPEPFIFNPRGVTLTLTRPGVHTLRLEGRKVTDFFEDTDDIVTLERSVTVAE